MEKTPKTKQLELKAKIAHIRKRLNEIKEYKRLLAVDGLEPDQDDKKLESELIVRLLYFEKQLNGPAPKKPDQDDRADAAPRRSKNRNDQGRRRDERKPKPDGGKGKTVVRDRTGARDKPTVVSKPNATNRKPKPKAPAKKPPRR